MEKNLDTKGRWRNRNVGFRVSEEEAKLLETVSDDNAELLITVQMVATIMKGMMNEYDG